MGFVELFLIGVGLSMDAFAVAVCKGLGMKRLDVRQALVIGLYFGGFQALMPFLGWLLGAQFQRFVAPVDHWIVFILLAFVGGKMIWEAVHDDGAEEEASARPGIDHREMLMLAVATSIDAFAVGITFAFLEVAIGPAVAVIGLTTFALSVLGVWVGHQFGSRFEKPATVAGGVVLILIGLRVLLEHLGVLAL